MKTLFIVKDPVAKQGVMSLCAYVKGRGHDADVLVYTIDTHLGRSLEEHRPDLIGFSCTTGAHQWAEKLAEEIKARHDIPVILGGPHATFFPEGLEHSPFDFLCQGEGEGALLDLLEALRDAGRAEIPPIPNIWSRSNGKVTPAAVRELIQDLDQLPFADRSVYFKHKPILKFHMDHFSFISGRGCPFSCAFCYNGAGKALYRGKGRYVRKRSVDHCIEELLQAKGQYPLRRVVFEDDTFILNEAWILEFLERYRESVALPFIGNTRADQVTEELVSALRRAGCTGVKMGVETGREAIRNGILKKGISDDSFRRAAALFHKAGIDIQSFNIVGIPGGSLEADWETVRFNIELGVKHAWCSIMAPYPKTEIMEFSIRQGYLRHEEIGDGFFRETYFSPSKLRIPDKRRVTNLHHFFDLCVQHPRLIPLVRILIALPLGFVYERLFKLHHSISLRGFYRFRWSVYLRFLWYCRKMYQ